MGRREKTAFIPVKFISLRATLCTEPVLGLVIVETIKKKKNEVKCNEVFQKNCKRVIARQATLTEGGFIL